MYKLKDFKEPLLKAKIINFILIFEYIAPHAAKFND